MLTATLIIIGDEILSGRTRDVHLQHFAERLATRGIGLEEVRVVGDAPGEIVGALRSVAGRTRYLFTTGGIGPTHDDRTVDALAVAFDLELVEDEKNLAAYADHRLGITEGARRMSRRPRTGEMVWSAEFPRSPAIRFVLPLSDGSAVAKSELFVLAGFPRVAVAQLEAVLPLLEEGQKRLSETCAFPVEESRVAGPLARLAGRFGAVEFGSYPQEPKDGRYETQVVARSFDEEALREAVMALEELAREIV